MSPSRYKTSFQFGKARSQQLQVPTSSPLVGSAVSAASSSNPSLRSQDSFSQESSSQSTVSEATAALQAAEQPHTATTSPVDPSSNHATPARRTYKTKWTSPRCGAVSPAVGSTQDPASSPSNRQAVPNRDNSAMTSGWGGAAPPPVGGQPGYPYAAYTYAAQSVTRPAAYYPPPPPTQGLDPNSYAFSPGYTPTTSPAVSGGGEASPQPPVGYITSTISPSIVSS